jgi:hypothetical protein
MTKFLPLLHFLISSHPLLYFTFLHHLACYALSITALAITVSPALMNLLNLSIPIHLKVGYILIR